MSKFLSSLESNILSLVKSGFKFLSSVKLAIFLIAAIAGMSVVATMVDNADTYHSWPFLGLILFFGLNLLLCTIKILPKLFKTWKRTVAAVGNGSESFLSFSVGDDKEASAEILAFFQANRYKISQEDNGTTRKILANKGKLSLLAPHLLHIAILIILAGAFLTMTYSESGGVFAYVGQKAPLTTSVRQVIGEGSAVKNADGSVGDDYIEVLDFQTVYDEQGDIDNWVTSFNLTIDGVQVVSGGETKVNYPYRFGKMMIYQNSYGKQFLVTIKGLSPEIDGDYSLPDGGHLPIADNMELMVMDLGENQTLVKVFQQNGDQEEVLFGKNIAVGELVEILPSVTIEYLAINPYTVLETKVTSGTNIVFLGFLLATIASMFLWSGRYRELQVIIDLKSNTLQVRCVCKNKMIVENTNAQLKAYFLEEEKQ